MTTAPNTHYFRTQISLFLIYALRRQLLPILIKVSVTLCNSPASMSMGMKWDPYGIYTGVYGNTSPIWAPFVHADRDSTLNIGQT